MGTFVGRDKREAMDRFARSEGYEDYQSLKEDKSFTPDTILREIE